MPTLSIKYLRAEAPGDFGPQYGDFYQAISKIRPEAEGTDEVKWNFTKFLVDREGHVVKRYEPSVSPADIETDLEQYLRPHDVPAGRGEAVTQARLSILDLAPIARGQTAGDSFAGSVALAQRAEELGYERVWYAEHHNIASIASSATSVLIAYVGAQTRTIRLGAGGIMLPNHAPLTIAEQFGTLAAMYPGRIDLGLGRAPGSDQTTMRALRRDPRVL